MARAMRRAFTVMDVMLWVCVGDGAAHKNTQSRKCLLMAAGESFLIWFGENAEKCLFVESWYYFDRMPWRGLHRDAFLL